MAKFTRQSSVDSFIGLVPFIGCIVFVLLYIIATIYYPGGNQVDKNAKGFSWMQNYWCNLLNENAINGARNPARPVAMSAMGVLCVTLIIFWFLFPVYVGFKKNIQTLIQVSGLLSMTIGTFLFTSFHDIIINVASLFGLVALVGTLAGLKKLQWKNLFWMGMLTIALIAVNNLLYYTAGLLFYLPIVQKITFLYFLTWISLISIGLYSKLQF